MKPPKKPRSYSDFTLQHLREMFAIENTQLPLHLGNRNREPSEWLLSSLERAKLMSLNSEKAKSELLIAPLLLELATANPHRFRCFSGNTLDVDVKNSLKGRCDFLLTKHFAADISAPIIAIFEAKDDNVDHWFGQCGAEMLAARMFNEDHNEPITIIHGAVTNGNSWRFLRLEGALLTIDTELYTTDQLAKLLGALQYLIDFYYQ